MLLLKNGNSTASRSVDADDPAAGGNASLRHAARVPAGRDDGRDGSVVLDDLRCRILGLSDPGVTAFAVGASPLPAGLACRHAARAAEQEKPAARKPPLAPGNPGSDRPGVARRLLATFPKPPKPTPAKPASSRPLPALPPHPVADFVTRWAGYDNKNRPPRHYDGSRRRLGLSRFHRIAPCSAPHIPSDWNIDHEL